MDKKPNKTAALRWLSVNVKKKPRKYMVIVAYKSHFFYKIGFYRKKKMIRDYYKRYGNQIGNAHLNHD